MARCSICDYSEDADTLYREGFLRPRKVSFVPLHKEFLCSECRDSIKDTLIEFESPDEQEDTEPNIIQS